jgi:hypothetical protein
MSRFALSGRGFSDGPKMSDVVLPLAEGELSRTEAEGITDTHSIAQAVRRVGEMGGGDLPQAADDRAHGDPGLTGPRAGAGGPARHAEGHSAGSRRTTGNVRVVWVSYRAGRASGPRGRVQPVPFGAVPQPPASPSACAFPLVAHTCQAGCRTAVPRALSIR